MVSVVCCLRVSSCESPFAPHVAVGFALGWVFFSACSLLLFVSAASSVTHVASLFVAAFSFSAAFSAAAFSPAAFSFGAAGPTTQVALTR